MREASDVFKVLLAGLTLWFPACRKPPAEGERYVLVSPVTDRAMRITGTNIRSFGSADEFRHDLEAGLSNLHRTARLPRLQQGGAGLSCSGHGLLTATGEHSLTEGFHLESGDEGRSGWNLGIDIRLQYRVTDRLLPVDGAAFISGSGVVPTAQEDAGVVHAEGSSLRATGTIRATWTAGVFRIPAFRPETGTPFMVTAYPRIQNGSLSVAYRNRIASRSRLSGPATVAATVLYEVVVDLCSGSGHARVWVNARAVIDETF